MRCNGAVWWCSAVVRWCSAVQWCSAVVQWCSAVVQWCSAVRCKALHPGISQKKIEEMQYITELRRLVLMEGLLSITVVNESSSNLSLKC